MNDLSDIYHDLVLNFKVDLFEVQKIIHHNIPPF